MIHTPSTGITLVGKPTLWVRKNQIIMAFMIFQEMFGSGQQTGMKKIIIKFDHLTTRQAHLMGNTGYFEVDHLWIGQKDYELRAVTGIYLDLDSKILDFVV